MLQVKEPSFVQFPWAYVYQFSNCKLKIKKLSLFRYEDIDTANYDKREREIERNCDFFPNDILDTCKSKKYLHASHIAIL